jgi:hypothetical protein
MLRATRDSLSTISCDHLDAVAIGCPHLSLTEFDELENLLGGRESKVPLYVCTARDILRRLESQGRLGVLQSAGVEFIVDTFLVVTSILPDGGGTLMTNSGKFAHYTPPNVGYDVVYGSLADCVASALTGSVVRDQSLWD